MRCLAPLLLAVLLFAMSGCATPLAHSPVAPRDASGTLRGVVADERGSPLPGAVVVLAPIEGGSPELAVQADIRGEFRVALAPGRYAGRATMPGFRESRVPEVLVTAGRETSLHVVLKAAPSPEVLPLGGASAAGYRSFAITPSSSPFNEAGPALDARIARRRARLPSAPAAVIA